jgi:hypothetical protein
MMTMNPHAKPGQAQAQAAFALGGACVGVGTGLGLKSLQGVRFAGIGACGCRHGRWMAHGSEMLR